MARLRGRSPKGQRLKARAPFGHWKTQTFIAGLRCHGLTAPFVVDAPMNRRIFETYVTTQLAPTSKRATSSFSTTSPPIKALWPRRPSEPGAHGSCSCRPTAPTSIQSKWHSPSSRRICARGQSDDRRPLGGHRPNLPTVLTRRMPKLLQDRRISTNLIARRSRPLPLGWSVTQTPTLGQTG